MGKVDPKLVEAKDLVTEQDSLEKLMQWGNRELGDAFKDFESDLRKARDTDSITSLVSTFRIKNVTEGIKEAAIALGKLIGTFLLPGGILRGVFKALRWLGLAPHAWVARFLRLMKLDPTKTNKGAVKSGIIKLVREGIMLLLRFLITSGKALKKKLVDPIVNRFKPVWNKFKCWLTSNRKACGKKGRKGTKSDKNKQQQTQPKKCKAVSAKSDVKGPSATVELTPPREQCKLTRLEKNRVPNRVPFFSRGMKRDSWHGLARVVIVHVSLSEGNVRSPRRLARRKHIC